MLAWSGRPSGRGQAPDGDREAAEGAGLASMKQEGRKRKSLHPNPGCEATVDVISAF